MNEAEDITGGFTWAFDMWSSMGYLALTDKPVARTETHGQVNIDYDADGEVVGVEIFASWAG